MNEETTCWPITLRRVAEIIGPAKALIFADSFGGLENIYIPKNPAPDNKIVIAIGQDAAQKMAYVFGGERIDVPRGLNRSLVKVQVMDTVGCGPDVARKLGCTERYVRKIRSEQRLLGKPTVVVAAAPTQKDNQLDLIEYIDACSVKK